MIVQANITGTFSSPVVALHSSASNGGQWKSFTEFLSGRFEVTAPNLPGYGVQAVGIQREQGDVSKVAEPIIDLIAEFGQPVHLVGHSFGAAVALKIALLLPELVKSLSLYEPAAFHFLNSAGTKEQSLFETISKVAMSLNQTGDNDTGMKTFIDFWNGAGAWNSLPPQKQECMAAVAPVVQSDFSHGFAETWTLEDLSSLSMPVLMMMGLDSPEVAQHASLLIANAIPQARLAMLPGLGHMAPVFEPDWVNPRIYEHIVNVERPIVNCNWPELSAA